MNCIIKSFDDTIEFAKAGRASDNWDGLKMWIAIKGSYEDVHKSDVNWSPIILNKEYSSFRDQVLKELPEHEESGSMNEANHFIIQCLRIPFKNKMTARRLIQVAYNIGQLQACESKYPKEYLNKFYEMKLDKFETYFTL